MSSAGDNVETGPGEAAFRAHGLGGGSDGGMRGGGRVLYCLCRWKDKSAIRSTLRISWGKWNFARVSFGLGRGWSWVAWEGWLDLRMESGQVEVRMGKVVRCYILITMGSAIVLVHFQRRFHPLFRVQLTIQHDHSKLNKHPNHTLYEI